MIEHGLGCLPFEEDNRDYKFKDLISCVGQYPEEYIPVLHSARLNQGLTSMCTAFALATSRYMFELHDSNNNKMFSPGYIYGNRDMFDYKGEGMMIRQALKTLQTCLNNDVEEFKKCSFQSLPREDFDYNDNEMKAVFNENISWSLNLLESYLKGAEKDIRLMQTLNDLTKYEYDIINQEVFKKINSYYDMKIQREKYKNNIPYFAEIYYRCVVGIIEEIFDVYSIDEIRNECN